MKRTPPAGGAAMRTPIASSSGRRSSRPVVASRFTASVRSVVSWRSSRLLRRHHDAHAGFVLEFARRQHQIELQLRAVAEQGGHLERVIGPLALAAGDERALERGVRAVIEQVHQRLADDRAAVVVAEQLEPGLVGVDDDAFLHLQDRVVRALQHRLQLAAVVARGLQRGVERALEAERAQLARHARPARDRWRTATRRRVRRAACRRRCRLRRSAAAPAASAPAARAGRGSSRPGWHRLRTRRRRPAVRG